MRDVAPTVSSLISNVLKTTNVDPERIHDQKLRKNMKDSKVELREMNVPVSSVLNERTNVVEADSEESDEMERLHRQLKTKMKNIRKRKELESQSKIPRNVIKKEDLMKLMSDLEDEKREPITPSIEEESNEESPPPPPTKTIPTVVQSKFDDSKSKQRARSISEEEETLRNKRRDEEVERLRREHLARKRKVEEEQRRRRMRMNATIEMNRRRRQKAQRRRRSNPPPRDFTRGDVDDIMENFVEQWTQCAPKDWEVPLSYEKSHERSSKIRHSYSERLRMAREKLRNMAKRNTRSYCDDDINKKKRRDFEGKRRSRSSSPPGFVRRRSRCSPEKEKKEAERICKLVETRVNLWAKDKSFLELISTVHKLLPRHCPDFSSSDQCVVDAKELRRRYREVLRRVHPDKIGKREGDVPPTVEEILTAQHAVSVLLSAKPKRSR